MSGAETGRAAGTARAVDVAEPGDHERDHAAQDEDQNGHRRQRSAGPPTVRGALFESMPLDPGEDLLLLYRARTAEEIIFRNELEEIARHRGARIGYVLGDGPDALSPAAFQRMVPDLSGRDVYVCGPPGLMTAVRLSLHTAGLPLGQLHQERLGF